MASGATQSSPQSPPVQPAQAAPRQPSRHEQAIGSQLSRTGRQVKMVDLGVALLVLGAGMLGFLLLAAVVDHWVAPLSSLARWAAFAVLSLGSIWWIAVRLVPLALRKVNPLYAAHTLEAAEPSLKNSLINFLMLRQQGHVRPVVLQGIEVHAARGLSSPSMETAVDRSNVIRAGIVLTALMVIASAYLFISPKSPLATFARVAAPWSNIAAPTRVSIKEIEPGETTVFLGGNVEISALVSGQGEEEPVFLVYRTVDGTILDARVPMTLTEGDPRWRAQLPPAGGVRQEMWYRIECGDAASPEFLIAVEQAPSFVVERVEYRPPAYTGRENREVEGAGDLSGLEGAEVVIHAVANRDMQRAQLQFDPETNSAAVGQKLTMQIDGRRATVRFKLRLTADRRTPWHSSYQLFFETPEGEASQQSIRHTIKVLPDLPPEVEVLQPEQREIEVPENSAVELQIRAIDPDFGLSHVWLSVDARGQLVQEVDLWESKNGESLPQLIQTYRFVPAALKLSQGDVAIVVAHAADNRHSPVSGSQEPSTARTPNYRITIVPPVEGESSEDSTTQGDGEGDEADPESDPTEGEGGSEEPGPSIPDGDPTRSEEESSDPNQREQQEEQESGGGSEGEQAEGMGGSSGGTSESSEGESDQTEGGEGGEGEASASDSQGEAGDSEPVPSDGSSEGEAIERVAQRLQAEEQQEDASPPESTPAEQNQAEQQSSESETSEGGEETSGESSQQGNPSEGGPGGAPSAAERLEQMAENIEQMGEQQEGSGEGGDPSSGLPQRPEPGSPEAEQRAENLEDLAEQLRDLREQIENGQGSEEVERAREAMERIEEEIQDQQSNGGEGLEENEVTPEEQELMEALDELNEALDQQESQTPHGDGEGQETQPNGSGEQAAGDEQSGSGDQQGTAEQQAGSQEPGSEQAGSEQAGSNGGESESQESAGPQGQQGSEETSGGGETPAQDNNAGSEATNRPQSTAGEQEAEPNDQGSGGGTSVSEHESDRQTEGEDGSHSGQGGEGAGEQSSQAGHDTPGSSSPSDEGAGAAPEQGEGEAGSEGGQGEESAEATGQAGDEAGEGSSARSGTGDQPGAAEQQADPTQQQPSEAQGDPTSEGESGTQPSGESGSGEAGENESESSAGQEPGQSGGRQQGPGGGGPTSGDSLESPQEQEDTAEESMEANLEYARETTDLVLEYLRDQEHNPDEELLKELGWTPEQLRDFIRRMESRRPQPGANDEAQRDYEEFLGSLGLVPPEAQTRREEAGGEDYGQADTGTRSEAPSEYYQRVDRAYGLGVQRGE